MLKHLQIWILQFRMSLAGDLLWFAHLLTCDTSTITIEGPHKTVYLRNRRVTTVLNGRKGAA